MSLEAFYEAVDGDLADVRGRLQTDERIERFVKIFLQDATYGQLLEAASSNDLQSEFRAAHTLKGTGRDLGFTRLSQTASDLAEALRPGPDGTLPAPDRAPELMKLVSAAYDELLAAAQVHL